MSAPGEPTTIRAHLEWIAAGRIDGNVLSWILEATEHAVAAIEILDDSERPGTWSLNTPIRNQTYRLISDPEVSA